jgi:cell wall-associated NlpC family hydrolase
VFSGRPRKLGSVACLTMAAVFALPSATAYASPSPSPKDVQKKLDDLNKQVDLNVQQYDKNKVDLATAKKKLDVATHAANNEQTTYDGLRQELVQLAATAYKNHTTNDVTAFLGSGNPQQLLDSVAVISEISKDRGSAATQLLQSAQRLQLDKGQAQQAYDQVNSTQTTLKTQKAGLDKQVTQQKKLLDQLSSSSGGSGGSGGSSGGGGPIGGTYTGPASGNARTALNYAYAQLGCHYSYGAEGPCSQGFDCSGLTQMAWAAAGVTIPRTSQEQYSQTRPVSNPQPGDLIFFSGLGHVAIYVGGGQGLEAPHTGANVRLFSTSSRSDIIGYGRP